MACLRPEPTKTMNVRRFFPMRMPKPLRSPSHRMPGLAERIAASVSIWHLAWHRQWLCSGGAAWCGMFRRIVHFERVRGGMAHPGAGGGELGKRSEEHTSELQSRQY